MLDLIVPRRVSIFTNPGRWLDCGSEPARHLVGDQQAGNLLLTDMLREHIR